VCIKNPIYQLYPEICQNGDFDHLAGAELMGEGLAAAMSVNHPLSN